jgi:cytochrome c peroxidase
MKIRIILYFTICVAIALFFISASNEKAMQKSYGKPKPIKFVVPKGFPRPPTNIFENNILTEEGFELGKKIFYDTRLSSDGQVSCESCHQQFAAFTTYDHDFSHGINDKHTNRNAPTLVNLAWMKEMHWDGSINHLEVQPLAPITDPNEMGETLESFMAKISADGNYRNMYRSAFGDEAITSKNILKAIAQFTGSLVSANSKYDKMKRGEVTFIAPEQKGYELFKQNCNSCHKEPLFTDNSFRNNGISLNSLNDIGRQKITGNKNDSLKFKVPTLRNIGVTLPYMHDGSQSDIYKVLDHYTNIDTTKTNVDPLLKQKINLTKKEKMELALFLYTLTDTSFTKNNRFKMKSN